MIPILYESNEIAFASNGLGRLRDCIDCKCSEERNGIYEVNFEYPVDGANFDLIQCGRIIGVTHDETGDVEPFDIVSYTKPIDGVVKFHAVHVSYRQSGIVAQGTGINSLADALSMLTTSAQPSNPFTYSADFTSTAYMASADGTPRSVRQFLGGIEGSILDAYGGEYEFDRFRVILHRSRGVARDLVIRYGVNMLDYSEDTDFSNTFSACVPYWRGNDNGSDIIVKGNRVDYGGTAYNGRNICVPLDLSDKFEDAPTTAQLEAEALRVMQSKQSTLPAQTISVDFVRLQDMGYEGMDNLLQCNLCDTIRVEFPRYNMSGSFKIVRTVYDVLQDKYDSMELGQLSTTLAEALGIQSQTDTLQSIDDLTVNDLNVTGGAAIAGVLTVGGANILDKFNYEDISDKLTLGGAWTGIIKKAILINRVVFYTIEATTSSFIANYQYTIATFASGYRPKANVIGNGYTTDGGFAPKAIVSVLTQTTGAVRVSASATTGSYFFVTGWFNIG